MSVEKGSKTKKKSCPLQRAFTGVLRDFPSLWSLDMDCIIIRGVLFCRFDKMTKRQNSHSDVSLILSEIICKLIPFLQNANTKEVLVVFSLKINLIFFFFNNFAMLCNE